MLKINQCALVINYLMKHGSISREEAKQLNITNLSARVWSLRNIGCDIEFSDGRYYLKREDVPQKVEEIDWGDNLFPDFNFDE